MNERILEFLREKPRTTIEVAKHVGLGPVGVQWLLLELKDEGKLDAVGQLWKVREAA